MFELLVAAAIAAPSTVGAPPPVHYKFQITRARGTIYNPWTRSDDPVELRAYRGTGTKDGDFVAPTIRVAPGQQLAIDLENRLEPCTQAQRDSHACFNETNLHTHGLWVSPSGNSDNVLVSIGSGETFGYRYDISEDHPAGTFWYHPHRHGAGFVQVGSGMAGALIVTGERVPTSSKPGDIDILLKDSTGRPFADRALLFQQIQYGCLDGKGAIEGALDERGSHVRPFTCSPGKVGGIESPDNDWDWVNSGRFTGINGKVLPRLEPARAGAFERWRLIHAGTREPVHLRLLRLDPSAPDLATVGAADQPAWMRRYCTGQPLTMWQIALDGLTRSSVRASDETPLFAGDRVDVLVRFPDPGRYCVVQDTARAGGAENPGKNPSRMLATIEAQGPAPEVADGGSLLAATLVEAAQRAFANGGDPKVRDRVVADLGSGLKLSAFAWHKTIEAKEVSGYREAILNIIETPTSAKFHINGRPYAHDRIDQVLPLGKAEEWHAISLLGRHPLHIHVNPFQIVSISDPKGRDVTDPAGEAFDPDYAALKGEWKDTIMLKQDHRIVFRTRYERFNGDFVTHCHIMFHGDAGMMQNLRIADEGESHEGGAHAAHD